jgi:hypothetical protein
MTTREVYAVKYGGQCQCLIDSILVLTMYLSGSYHYCWLIPGQCFSCPACSVCISEIIRKNIIVSEHWRRRDGTSVAMITQRWNKAHTWRWLFRWYRVRPFIPINLSTNLGVASAPGSTIKWRQQSLHSICTFSSVKQNQLTMSLIATESGYSKESYNFLLA